jgi:hypothetical protein
VRQSTASALWAFSEHLHQPLAVLRTQQAKRRGQRSEDGVATCLRLPTASSAACRMRGLYRRK